MEIHKLLKSHQVFKEIENNGLTHIEAVEGFRHLINKFIEENRLEFSPMEAVLPFTSFPCWYKYKFVPVKLTKKQVQIIPHEEHCYVIFYLPNEGLQIFNSAHDQLKGLLPEKLKTILKQMYPGVEWRSVKPATQQQDGFSCAIFSMAYTLLVLNNKDPGKQTFDATDNQKLRQDLSNKLLQMVCDIHNNKNRRSSSFIAGT